MLNDISLHPVHATFDYHSSQIITEHKANNRGEMSDVLLLSQNYFISIECKFLSNMHFDKDVMEVQERIIAVSSYLKLKPIQVLLLKKEKWIDGKKFAVRENSFYTLLQKHNAEIPVVVLFWEDLIELIDNAKVLAFLKMQLMR